MANFCISETSTDPVFPFAVTDVLPHPRNSHRSRSIAGRRKAAVSLLILGGMLLPITACRHHATIAADRRLDFNQDVQPILATRCFACHGPDPEMRKAGLRLDLGEFAMKKRPGHPDAIGAGHPEESALIQRIESKDPHFLMPENAQREAKPMKPEEIAILREWIKQGA